MIGFSFRVFLAGEGCQRGVVKGVLLVCFRFLCVRVDGRVGLFTDMSVSQTDWPCCCTRSSTASTTSLDVVLSTTALAVCVFCPKFCKCTNQPFVVKSLTNTSQSHATGSYFNPNTR